jgi:hypothetical protein
MPIEVKWYDAEQTVILYDFSEHWTWDEMYAAVEQVTAMIASVPHRVDSIMNLTRTSIVPTGAIGHVKSLSGAIQPNFGIGVVLSRNTFIKTIFQMFSKLYPKQGSRFAVVESEEQGLAMIQAHRTAQRAAQRAAQIQTRENRTPIV